MSGVGEPSNRYDLFLSHGTPDKEWVRALQEKLESEGLRAFLDEKDLKPGGNWVIGLSDGLKNSRFLILIITRETLLRPWVVQEWTGYMAKYGPTGRIIPVLLEPREKIDLPPILCSIQALQADDRDATRVARKLAQLVGRPTDLKEGDARRLTIGQELVFEVERVGDLIAIQGPTGPRREVSPPWRDANRFSVALLGFNTLTRNAIESDSDRKELFGHASALGDTLSGLLFDEAGVARLREAMIPNGPRPLVVLRSSDDTLLSLPWELLRLDSAFLVRDRRIDLVRCTSGQVGTEELPREPSGPFKLVVNVSAPEGSKLSYEAESYRITKALTELCPLVPTELGTLADLVETVARERPTGIHFSGHGAPGQLVFEDDEGREAAVTIKKLLEELRDRIPDRKLPPFFYLASCHGNTLGEPEKGTPGSETLAARLHREGVIQVVGYYGPIVDELSTRAEEALYAAIAEGHPTSFAVHLARRALTQPLAIADPVPRDVPLVSPAPDLARDTHPFAWAQLVLYHRGADFPLSRPVPAGWRRRPENVLHRTFQDVGIRRILATGFIGRRTDLHRLRQRTRRGDRVFVLQGLGGLGKSTLAVHMLPLLESSKESHCLLWCQDAEKHTEGANPVAEALVGQLSEFARKHFGLDWEGVVQHVDRAAGDDPARRFASFLQALLAKLPRLVIYLDNLESLLIGPDDPRNDDPAAFGTWRSPALATLWSTLKGYAEATDRLFVVASCRYISDDFGDALIPVNLLPDDAVFRMMEWFPALRRLSVPSRRELVDRLDGHPRAVEFANDLIQDALSRWGKRYGEWRLPDRPTREDVAKEWEKLVEPTLPKVQQKLRDNLLFDAIWDHVLDDRARRMLFRMTLLRRPWEWDLMLVLGEPDEPPDVAEATAERLRSTSLLEQVNLPVMRSEELARLVPHFTLHPATVQFISQRFGEGAPLRLATHRRLGDYLEAQAAASPYIETYIEAGHHLFQAGEYDRAYELLGSASEWLQDRGRVREGLSLLKPFLAEAVPQAMRPELVGRLLGTLGLANARLGQAERAIGFYEQQLVIVREIGDRQGEGAALGNLGNAYAALGQAERAIGFYEQHLAIARDRRPAGRGERPRQPGQRLRRPGPGRAGHRLLRAAVGHRARDRRPAGRGERPWQPGPRLRRPGPGRAGHRLLRAGHGDCARSATAGARGPTSATWAAPTPPWARPSGPSASTSRDWRLREIGDRRGEGNALGNLGLAYAALGQAERAIGFYEQGLAIAREIGDRRGEGNALGNLGLAYAALGQAERAIGFYEQGLAIAARSATGGARGTPSATWAMPTPPWARPSGPSACSNKRFRLGMRSRTRKSSGSYPGAWNDGVAVQGRNDPACRSW